MDPSPLRRLLGRGRDVPAELSAALADLDRLVGGRPELSEPGRTLADLLAEAFGRPPARGPQFPDRDAARSAWADGVPLFRNAPPALDGESLRARGLALARALRAANPAARPLARAIRREKGLLAAWAREALAGRPEEVAHRAGGAGLDPDLAASVLRLALLPELAPLSKALDEMRPAGLWGLGDCPQCGSRPLLAESRGLEQRRALRCGLCAADWPGDRLRCPSCGETDHRALRSTFVEGEESRHRLSRCATCGLALKVVSTLTPLSPPALLVAELATVHLDLIAEGS